MYRASFLIDPAIAVKRFLFIHADLVELAALVFLQLWVGKRALRVSGRDATAVRWNVGDQRTHRTLQGFLTMLEIRVETTETENAKQRRRCQAQQKIENTGGL